MRQSSHKDLIVWQKSIALASNVHAATAAISTSEYRDLCQQMRRCAVSIASNIAEGAARCSRNDYLRFLNIARSSLAELETQIYICIKVGLFSPDHETKEDSAEVGRMLTKLIQRLREQRSLDSPESYGLTRDRGLREYNGT